jgi:protein phosphatase
MKFQKFTQIGTREKNEDYLGNKSNTFIVCDGIGGYSNGEVASKYVVEKMLLLTENSEINKNTIQKHLNQVQKGLNKLNWWKFKKTKIGTTFVGFFKSKNECFVAHIGDSRLYFIRPSETKIWHTWDHSPIGKLLKSKQISREEARVHELKSSLDKSISTSKKTVEAEIVTINELIKGDIFFLCTDGVYEVWLEHKLMELLCKQDLNIEQKIENIRNHCQILSTDNNSAILIEIEKEDEFIFGNNEEINWIKLIEFN